MGIITVLSDVELPAVKRAFNIIDKNTEPKDVDGMDYWLKNIESKGSTLSIAITTAYDKGNENAKKITKDFINKFNPEVVMLVGIAAGVKSEVKLGDVVISKEVCYYEPSKITSNGVQPRWLSKETGDFPLSAITTFSRNNGALYDWHDNFHRVEGKLRREGLPDPLEILHPEIHIGTIASGEKILADGSLQVMHDNIDANIRAGETEGWGFLRAANEEKKDWIVIRGISDFGDDKTKDGKNKDRYHHSAANAAATFALTFLKSGYYPRYTEDINEASDPPIDSAEGHKPLPKKSETNPWTLFGQSIELSSLSKEDFWTTVADGNTKTLKIRIILPSGKFEGAIGQLPLISDCMFIPDVIASIANRIKETGFILDVRTFFDIDVVHEQGGKFELRNDILSDSNLILTGTGDINLATRLLLKHELLFNKRPGPTSPESPVIHGVNEEYNILNNQDLGFLSVFRSPLNDKRIGIFTCGTYAIGTLGAQKLLDLYIEGEAKQLGNNRIDRKIPAKIVNFRRTKYPFQLLDSGSTLPQIELRNIDVDSLIEAIGVRE